jgi:hypothetical protein
LLYNISDGWVISNLLSKSLNSLIACCPLLGFNNWNFLEFTLAATERGHEGLLKPVDGDTLMPRLRGGMLAPDDTSSKAVIQHLGLLKPWTTAESL